MSSGRERRHLKSETLEIRRTGVLISMSYPPSCFSPAFVFGSLTTLHHLTFRARQIAFVCYSGSDPTAPTNPNSPDVGYCTVFSTAQLCFGARGGYCHGGIHPAKPRLYRAGGSSITSPPVATANPSHRAIQVTAVRLIINASLSRELKSGDNSFGKLSRILSVYRSPFPRLLDSLPPCIFCLADRHPSLRRFWFHNICANPSSLDFDDHTVFPCHHDSHNSATCTLSYVGLRRSTKLVD